jgi:GNAT superfamily N-acetyltransferase
VDKIQSATRNLCNHSRGTHMIRFICVEDDATRRSAARLIREYLDWIQRQAADTYDLAFDIDAMVASDLEDGSKFYAPHGRFYLALRDDVAVGVGCLKRLTSQAAEIQRMYVQPQCRGTGIGRLLLERLLADCREMGFKVARLESLRFLASAHALYRSAGFVDVPPYAGSSMQDYQSDAMLSRYLDSVVFMELRL